MPALRTLLPCFFAAVLFAACGGPDSSTSACAPDNCQGCCDASGQCQLGRIDQACGIFGAQCTACPTGTTCGAAASCVAVLVPAARPDGGATFDGGQPSNAPGSRCAGATTACGATCRDLTTDENNCGSCGHACEAGVVCNRGVCLPLPNDCTTMPCPGDFGCNPETRRCTSGCFSNSDCRGGATCTNGSCGCSSSFQLQCGAVCASADNADCSCDPGSEARGGSCVDVNECTRGTFTCAAGSVCVNTPGAWECRCPEGTIGSPGSCEVDECALNNGGCGAHGECVDYPGSPRYCSCAYGYTFDGTTCAPTCTAGQQNCVDASLACYPGPNGARCLSPGVKAQGALCVAAQDCQRGLSCTVNAATGFGACEATCYSSCGTGFSCVGSLCRPNDSTACQPLAQDCSSSSEGCYLGQTGATCVSRGNLAEGQACAYLNDCGPGLVCLSDVTTASNACRRFCDLGSGTGCAAGRTCIALDTTGYGACL